MAEQDAEFQKDTVSIRSNTGMHPMAGGLFVKHPQSGEVDEESGVWVNHSTENGSTITAR